MFIQYFLSRLKAFFFCILSILKRPLCFLSRRRRDSHSDCEVLHTVCVNENVARRSANQNDDHRDWNSWDDSPRTVTEHIEQYRISLVKKNQPPDEPKVDFFQDMTPAISRQKKLLIKTENAKGTNENFSRLQPVNTTDIPIIPGAELEEWTDDGEQAGWEEIDNVNVKKLIRQQQKEIRDQRQHQKQKQHTGHTIIAKKLNTKLPT